ncbi:MAG: efflux RND transporter periplasmic adaptor subunit [Cecembia sp.]
MKRAFILLAGLLFWFASCHSPHDHHHEEQAETPSVSLLAYTENHEVFIDFAPLVSGRSTTLFVHLTQLGDTFQAVEEAKVDLQFELGGKIQKASTSKAASPGIFELDIVPEAEGKGKLMVNIQAGRFTEQIRFDELTVYPNLPTAVRDLSRNKVEEEIIYFKNQAWKIDFANAPVVREEFKDIFKTSGQILPAPGDETIITAKSSGTVVFVGNKTIIGSTLHSGDRLFTISGAGLTSGNPDLVFKEAKNRFEQAKAEYERAQKLVENRIISQRDFLEAKTNFENAQNSYEVISRNYSASGQSISSPISGYLKNVLVTEGQFVEAGTPLAQISKNKKLLLQAQVSQKHFHLLSNIQSANFRIVSDPRVYATEQMNGRVISYGRSTNAQASFIPIIFEIDNIGNIIPGAVAEVYLKSGNISNALTIPVEALMEELGNFYVFVQTNGESFQKREIQLGGNDGKKVRILSGLKEGERVVTKGAYAIKLASATGAIPEHGHMH